MKKFSQLQSGDEFFSTCSISKEELKAYLDFARIKNVMLDINNTTASDNSDNESIVSGRAVLSRMEGEFTRLDEIYGNFLVLYGSDGDKDWQNRNTRFLKPLYTGEILQIKFTIVDKSDIDEEFGKIVVNFEGTKQNGELVLVSKQNLYRIKKKPPENQ